MIKKVDDTEKELAMHGGACAATSWNHIRFFVKRLLPAHASAPISGPQPWYKTDVTSLISYLEGANEVNNMRAALSKKVVTIWQWKHTY